MLFLFVFHDSVQFRLYFLGSRYIVMVFFMLFVCVLSVVCVVFMSRQPGARR